MIRMLILYTNCFAYQSSPELQSQFKKITVERITLYQTLFNCSHADVYNMSLEQFNASLNWRILYEEQKQKRIEEEIDKEKNKNKQLQEQKKKYNSANSYNRR